MLAMAKYVARSSAIAARWLDDKVVIMTVKDSALFELNPAASAIWQAADGNITVASIVAKLFAGPDLDLGPAARDAEDCVSELASHGILILFDEPLETQLPGSPGVHIGGLPVRAINTRRLPYEKPAFRWERVFETMALSCGKAQGTQGQCQLNRKVS